MSVLEYIACDKPLPPMGAGEDCWTGAVCIIPFNKADILEDIYTQKEHCAYIDWEYTDEQAQQIIDYIAERLSEADAIELWHIWLGGSFAEDKKDTRPKLKADLLQEDNTDWDDWKLNKYHKKEITILQLNEKLLKAFFDENTFIQRCLTITR